MKAMYWIQILLATGAALLLSSAGCGGAAPKGLPAEKAEELQVLQNKRDAHLKQLSAMDAKQLAQELTADSEKGREPFNSPAYREVVGRGANAGTALKEALGKADRSSLLTLLALRKVDPAQYHALEQSFRVGVLVDALQNSKYFNTWGIPCLYWEDAGKALIEEGSGAESALLPLLRDERSAPVFGSEGATVAAQYHYRVRDYAFAFLNEIRQKKCEPMPNVADRDRAIEQMMKETPAKKK